MKHILIALALVALFVGCKTADVQEFKRWTCDTAFEAYHAYKAAEATGLLTPDIVAKAQVAASFGAVYCEWPTAKGKAVDTNGVLIVRLPL